MLKKIKKIFFYILGTSISFLGSFKSVDSIIQNNIVHVMYWVPQAPEPTTELDLYYYINDIINWILLFIWIIIAPIIFLIWLYFFLTKKLDKKRKEKWIKYMKRAVILFVIVFLLWELVKWFFDFFVNNWVY
jgi:hypothetical protein